MSEPRVERDTDATVRFALVFVVTWVVAALLPRLAAPAALTFVDAWLLVPLAMAIASIVSNAQVRYWLRLVAIPVTLSVCTALCEPLRTPSTVAWICMAALSLLAYWLWVLQLEGVEAPLVLETQALGRSSLVPAPMRRPLRAYLLPAIGATAAAIVFVVPTYFAAVERRAFVLALATAFVIMALVGGVVPMLRLEKRRADRKEVRRRAWIMLFYALACLVILWGYTQYRRL